MSPSRQPSRRSVSVTAVGLDRRRGVFMISVAAELAEMHPQTLRMYEARGLITPRRSPKNTRLYSYDDVERLRRIQQMTVDDGLNLAGVETVLTLERELERARTEIAKMRERATELEQQMTTEIDRVRRSLRAEIVPYGAYDAIPNVPPTSSAHTTNVPPASSAAPPGAAGSGEGRGSGRGRGSRKAGNESVSIPIDRAKRRASG